MFWEIPFSLSCRWQFVISSWFWQLHNCALNFILTVVCIVDLWTCDCFEMAPQDFPDLFKSAMLSFRSMRSALESPIVTGVSNKPLLKISHQANHTEEVTKMCFTQFSIITNIDCSSYCMHMFEPAGLVTFLCHLIHVTCCPPYNGPSSSFILTPIQYMRVVSILSSGSQQQGRQETHSLKHSHIPPNVKLFL